MAEGREALRNKEPGQRTKPRVMASAPSVVQQARLMDSAGTAWHAVKYGNLEMITKLFPNQCNVYARGPVGENVLHMAMLLNTPSTLAIARYLIKLYGRALVNCPFQERRNQHDPPGAYEGETALHIAIINKDFDMVKFLVQNGADIRARAWGPFFGAEGPMYYGEYPLSFAACTGQKDVVAYLKRHGARVNADRDIQGNTALHLCVVHGQQEMYDFLVEYCAASDRVVNNDGHTPLVLAATMGKTNMVQHIYNKRRRAFYTFGRVTSYSLSLREIDTVQDEDEYVPNVLETVVRKGHTDLLEEPLISTLLRFKWDAFAKWLFLGHFVGYLVLELSQTFLIWLHSTRDHWNQTSRESQEYVGLSLAIVMAGIEIMDYINWSREAYHRRLVMSKTPHFEPPLYPIPGENQGGSVARGGLFARISARMGFPGSAGSGSGGDFFQRLSGGNNTNDQQQQQQGAKDPSGGSGAAQQRGDGDRRSFAERLGLGPVEVRQPSNAAPSSIGAPSAASLGSGGSALLNRPASNANNGRAGAVSGPSSTRPGAPVASAPVPHHNRSVSPFQNAATAAEAVAAATATAAEGSSTLPRGSSPLRLSSSEAQPGAAASSSASRPSSPVGGGNMQRPLRAPKQLQKTERVPGPMGEGVEGGESQRQQQQQQQQQQQRPGDAGCGAGPMSMCAGSGDESNAAGTSAGAGCSAAAGAGGGAGADHSGAQWHGPGRPLGEANEGHNTAANGTGAAEDSGAGSSSDAAAEREGGAFAAVMMRGRSSNMMDDDEDESDPVSVGVGERRLTTIRSFMDLQALRGTSSGAGMTPNARQSPRGSFAGSVPGSLGGAPPPGSYGGAPPPGSYGVAPPAGSLGGAPAGSYARAPASAGIPIPGAPGPSSSSQSFSAGGGYGAGGQPPGGLAGSYPPSSSGGFGPGSHPAAAIGQGLGFDNRQRPGVMPAPASMPRLSAKSVSFPPNASGAAFGLEERAAAAVQGLDRSWTYDNIAALGVDAKRLPSFNAGRVTSMFGASTATPLEQAQPSAEISPPYTPGASASGPSFVPGDDRSKQLERQRTRTRNGGGDLPPGIGGLKRSDTMKRGGGGDLPMDKTYKKPLPGEVEREMSTKQEPDVEAGQGGGGAIPPEQPHQTHVRAFFETTREGLARMLEDPWLFIWHLHLILTFIHFITWRAAYGGVNGPGPSSIAVKEFDDVVVSLMGLTGWLAVIYFFRGIEATGKLAVVLERCAVDVLKFISLFLLWDIGFTLAFYTMQKGVLWVTNTPNGTNTYYINPDEGPFKSIPYGLMSLIIFAHGAAVYESTCNLGFVASEVFCTIYFVLYLATVVLLLMYLLIAMIIRTYNTTQSIAEKMWRRRWAMYVLKAERRTPHAWLSKHRLGQLAWDPKTSRPAYSHVFEVVDEGKDRESEERAQKDLVKLAEQLLETIKKKQ